MTAPARLALFAATIAIALAGGAAAGSWLDPDRAGSPPVPHETR